jgi:hypothetical protein
VVVENGLPAVITDHVFWVDLSVTWSTALQRKACASLVRLADYMTMSILVSEGRFLTIAVDTTPSVLAFAWFPLFS